MDTNSEFNPKQSSRDESGAQFRIEVADGDQGRYFSIRQLGHERYEILDDDGTIGTIQLDEADHAHCESQGCELDMPILHAIRDQIRFHLSLRNSGE